MNKLRLIFIFLLYWSIAGVYGQSIAKKTFVHPGMAQGREDLEYMKRMVRQGQEPWLGAFERLKAQTPADFTPSPKTHISVGAYNANNQGGREFSQSSKNAYNNALLWYITEDRSYADKAIQILRAWSDVLWDFDDNNAKLNVGLDAPGFLQAAEILRYTDSGWKDSDIQRFEKLSLDVFYPVIKDFFTEANGNWDASMIHTMLCIGIFSDNQEIFQRAVDRFFRGPGNSGITKYIYPNGQIQETTRDWDHVQLGIGEFAKAAQVAWTQGVDFYSAADNRLALGFEYTGRFMLGDQEIPVYGKLSVRNNERYRDIYESVYDHYHNRMGLDMPYTEKIIQSQTRKNSSLMTLTGIRAPRESVKSRLEPLAFSSDIASVVSLVGATQQPEQAPPADAVYVNPGDSIQKVLDRWVGKGKWIILRKGIHQLHSPLRIPQGITLAGEGKQTVLFLARGTTGATVVNATADLHDVTIRDLLIEGANSTEANDDPNHDRRLRSYMSAASRGGISFLADSNGQMRNIRIERVTVQNCTKNGVTIRGARDVTINNCDFSDNGSSVVPGAGFHHNLHLTRVRDCEVSNSRFDASPWGSGVDLSFATNCVVIGNETARNRLSGIRCTESHNVLIKGNLVEGNDEDGICLDQLSSGSTDLTVTGNVSQYNGKGGIFFGSKVKGTQKDNNTIGNGTMHPLSPDYAADPMKDWEEKFTDFLFFSYEKDGHVLPYRLHKPVELDTDKKYPLVLFMHGAGERGTDNRLQFFRFRTVPFWEQFPCYVLAPQCPAKTTSPGDGGDVWVNTPFGAASHSMNEKPTWPLELAMEVLDKIIAENQVDEQRIYVTGLSMGGFATWELLQRENGKFAAAVPVCGGADLAYAPQLVNTPIWAFHGDSDDIVLPSRSRDMVSAIKAAGGDPILTELPGVGHGAWDRCYGDSAVWDWLFKQKIKN